MLTGVGQTEVIQEGPRAQEGMESVVACVMRPRLTVFTEGKASHHLPVPLLQSREVRLSLYRKEIGRRKPTVQGVRPDIPDQY